MNIKQFISHTLIALIMVASSRVLIAGLDHPDFSIGNYLWLPIGAAIFSYLWFGFKAFPGVLSGYLIAEVLIEGGMADISQREVLSRAMSSLAPIFAIVIMRLFSLPNIFNENKIKYGPFIFLVFLSAIISTLLKTFFVYHSSDKFLADPVGHIGSYLMGDMIGGIVYIYVGIKLSRIFLKNKLI